MQMDSRHLKGRYDMENRKIRSIVKNQPAIEGAGVHLHRAIGFGPPEMYDPFLLLDDFRSHNPEHYLKGFPWHPHRGMETISYVLKGEVEHRDSLDNRGVIGSGDVQWMTAGSGIIHQEMPKGDTNRAIEGIQLWSNLPAANKMMAPRYRTILSKEIPEVTDPDGAIIKVIAGSVGDVEGPVRDVMSKPEFLDVTIPAGKSFAHATPRGHTVFAYVIGGKGLFDYQPDGATGEENGQNRLVGDGHVVLFFDGDQMSVGTLTEPVRFLLISGKPLREPIAWKGPIVMNTEEELRTAFDELEQGTFIKHRAAN
jgi:quercetin 2,3-dioxygenase